MTERQPEVAGPAFRPHDIVWDRGKSARYWNFLSRHASVRRNYFSEQVADSVLAYLRRHRLALSGRVLDFGCGPGFFLAKLAAGGIRCEGIDFSAQSVEEARVRLAGLPLCTGVRLAETLPTDLPQGGFDLVVGLESVEHILPEEMAPTFAEIRRLLKPEGRLLLTTPNEEDLEESKMMCPECGCIFHRMQHIRSWSTTSLSGTLEGLGWQTEIAEAVLFRQNGERFARLKERLDRLRRRTGPHLVWVGRP